MYAGECACVKNTDVVGAYGYAEVGGWVVVVVEKIEVVVVGWVVGLERANMSSNMLVSFCGVWVVVVVDALEGVL